MLNIKLSTISKNLRDSAKNVDKVKNFTENSRRFLLRNALDNVSTIGDHCKKDRVIYVLESEAIASEALVALALRNQKDVDSEAKNVCSTGSSFKLSRVNQGTRSKSILYVGSSLDIVDRLKEHLCCHKHYHYGMHLPCWLPNSCLNRFVTVYWWNLGSSESEPAKVAQVIEDGIWDQLLPIFGRKGDK